MFLNLTLFRKIVQDMCTPNQSISCCTGTTYVFCCLPAVFRDPDKNANGRSPNKSSHKILSMKQSPIQKSPKPNFKSEHDDIIFETQL